MVKKIEKQIRKTKYPLWDFDLDEIVEHCNGLDSPELAIGYLEFVKKERRNFGNPFHLDINLPIFLTKIDNEIFYHHKRLELKIKTQSKIKKSKKLNENQNNIDIETAFKSNNNLRKFL